MITVWWSMAGIIHYEFLKPGKTINSEIYCRQLDAFHQKLLKKQPDLVNCKTKLLLHDNAPSHVAKQTIHKLKELGYEILPHPPYSPDISPTDYHLFLSLDNFLRSKKFSNITDIEKAFIEFIGSRRPDFFKSGINKLVERWKNVINANGAYFDE
jgi:[histone H3]-lysine36 N-dimethyltransferase SETMAR